MNTPLRGSLRSNRNQALQFLYLVPLFWAYGFCAESYGDEGENGRDRGIPLVENISKAIDSQLSKGALLCVHHAHFGRSSASKLLILNIEMVSGGSYEAVYYGAIVVGTYSDDLEWKHARVYSVTDDFDFSALEVKSEQSAFQGLVMVREDHGDLSRQKRMSISGIDLRGFFAKSGYQEIVDKVVNVRESVVVLEGDYRYIFWHVDWEISDGSEKKVTDKVLVSRRHFADMDKWDMYEFKDLENFDDIYSMSGKELNEMLAPLEKPSTQ